MRGSASAPDRSDIEPSAVRELLGDIFVLAYDAEAGYPFRVAGTRVCALLGRDLKDESFSALFTPQARHEIEGMIAVVAEETLPAIGMLISSSQCSRVKRRIPSPSAPITSAIGPVILL